MRELWNPNDEADHPELGRVRLLCRAAGEWWICERSTGTRSYAWERELRRPPPHLVIPAAPRDLATLSGSPHPDAIPPTMESVKRAALDWHLAHVGEARLHLLLFEHRVRATVLPRDQPDAARSAVFCDPLTPGAVHAWLDALLRGDPVPDVVPKSMAFSEESGETD